MKTEKLKINLKASVIAIMAAVLCVAAQATVFAGPYKVTKAVAYQEGQGIFVQWETTAKTPCLLWLIKGASAGSSGKALLATKMSAETSIYDITHKIQDHGAGDYCIKIEPTMSCTPMEDSMTSNTIKVTQEMIGQSEATYVTVPVTAGPGNQPGKWTWEKDGSRHYRNGDGTIPTGWLNINGSWYLFDGAGKPLTGWHWVKAANGKERCYYMGYDGVCAINTITPDGYSVNNDGAWIVQDIIQER